MCLFDSSFSSDLHLAQTSYICSGTGSSQSIFSSQRHWRRIFIVMMVGENQPRPSNVLAMSETRIRLVTSSKEGKSVTSHSTPFQGPWRSYQVLRSHEQVWSLVAQVRCVEVHLNCWNSTSSIENLFFRRDPAILLAI